MKLAVAALSLLAAAAIGADACGMFFQRIAVFPICQQLDPNCNVDTETVAEIVAVTDDGMTVVYTDSRMEAVGFVDISDPSNPTATGFIQLNGEPTSVAVVEGSGFALVALNESEDFVNTAGSLIVIDIDTMAVVGSIDLGGQPDSIAVKGHYAMIAIENERDEDLGDGAPPQLPAGYVVGIDMNDDPNTWVPYIIELEGINGQRFPSDPEPEFVSISEDHVAAVTLQENNAIALIDVPTKLVIGIIDAGFVTVGNVDLTEDRVIDQSETALNALREPDGVTWIDARYFATADEGDLDGGSRGFSIFDFSDGSIAFTSGNSMEHVVAAAGHYPEERSSNKGNEPENVAVGVFGECTYLFVNSERSSAVFVYNVNDPTNPSLVQVLPTGKGPEGAVAIAKRNLLIVASKVDSRNDKIRSSLSVYFYGFQQPSYPTLLSSGSRANGTPIPWGAISGLAAEIRDVDPVEIKTMGGAGAWSRRKGKGGKGGRGGSSGDSDMEIPGIGEPTRGKSSVTLYAVEDSFYRMSRFFTIDATTKPALLTAETRIMDHFNLLKNAPMAFKAGLVNSDNTVNIDAEGIAVSRDGELWICSEGSGTAGDDDRPIEFLNYLIKITPGGNIAKVVTLPDFLNKIQRRFGFEGCAMGSGQFANSVVVVFQRAWGDEENPRIGVYNTITEEWANFFFYPLDEPESQNGGWVCLSDIAPIGDGGKFLVLERDNQGGPDGVIKRTYEIDLGTVAGGGTVNKTLVLDLVPHLLAEGGLPPEKIEGLTIDPSGDIWIINDNDGLSSNSGETLLLNVATSNFSPADSFYSPNP